MMNYKYIGLFLALLLSFNVIWAQESLSLEQCRQLAVEHNKQLKKAQYQTEEAKAYQKVARTSYLPAISADATLMHYPKEVNVEMPGGFLPTAASEADALAGNYSGVSNVYSPGMSFNMDNLTLFTFGPTISQPIFAGGKIYYSNKKATTGVAMAELNYKLKYSDIIEQTDKAFWQLAMLEANIELAESYIKLLNELEAQMSEMYSVGLIPASEKLKVSVQKNEAELQLQKVQNGYTIAKMYLNQTIGQDLNKDLSIQYNNIDAQLIDVQAGIESAMNKRYELKLLQKQVEMAEYDKKIAMADYLPTAGVSLQYSASYVSEFNENFEFNPLVSAQVSIPIFKWGQGIQKQKAAKYSIMQAKEDLSNTNDLINLEVNQTRIKVEETYKSIAIAKSNVAVAEESLQETQASFDAGLNSTSDLLSAQADLQKAKSTLISLQVEYKILDTQWKKVTGHLAQD